MQSKVSIVITCYNKENYIDVMFDSILAQEWDNIELILVNDGSTDGTRDIIAEYEIRLRTRGFDVVVIDQENRGVAAAAKTGLEHITGDYVCIIDADDELDSKYVSTMASWLEDNDEYDYCTCGCRYFTGLGKEKEYGEIWTPVANRRRPLVEDYLIVNIRWAVWAYMARVKYVQSCRIIETYITNMRESQEPSYMIPLTAYAGIAKIFKLDLYHRRLGVDGAISQQNTYEKMVCHLDEYLNITRKAINLLSDEVINEYRKQKLISIANYAMLCRKYSCARSFNEMQNADILFSQIVSFANDFFSVSPKITRQQTRRIEWELMQEINKAIIRGRIIGYGAMGRAASKYLPLVKETPLEPTELWDINGDGMHIKKPDFDSLDVQDTVIVFPSGQIEKELQNQLSGMPFKVLYQRDIKEYVLSHLYNRMLKTTVANRKFV